MNIRIKHFIRTVDIKVIKLAILYLTYSRISPINILLSPATYRLITDAIRKNIVTEVFKAIFSSPFGIPHAKSVINILYQIIRRYKRGVIYVFWLLQ